MTDHNPHGIGSLLRLVALVIVNVGVPTLLAWQLDWGWFA